MAERPLPPHARELVEILGDMLRSAIVWEAEHGNLPYQTDSLLGNRFTGKERKIQPGPHRNHTLQLRRRGDDHANTKHI